MNPVIYALILIVITGVFGLVCFIISKRAIRRIKELKFDVETRENTKRELENQCKSLSRKRDELAQTDNSLTSKMTYLTELVKEKEDNLKSLENIYNQQLQDKKENINNEAEEFKKKIYNDILKEVEECRISAESQKKLINDEYEKEKENFEKILKEYKDKQNSIIKINKEQEEIREKAKFYQLHIKDEDLSDIKALQSVKHHLNHPEILDKLIYKTYYEKAYTDLIGRIIGQKKITGIYKLTNLLNEKVYIGQAVDIAERWRQHLKRAVGAEPMTTNKLYPAMQEDGPYNFTWQVVEECKKEELTVREKYWIEFYEGQGYGYNIKG